MQFTTSREALLRPLQLVSGALMGRPNNPILSHVLLQVNNQQLAITGTDLEVEMVAMLDVHATEHGSITVPARKLLDICRALPIQASLDLTLDNDRLTLRSGRSRYMLNTLPAEQFPKTDELASVLTFELSQIDLLALIEATQFSMASQDVRYYLNGLSLETENKSIRTVSSDGHRLATSLRECLRESIAEKQIILPRKAVTELSRLLTQDNNTPITVQIGPQNFRALFPQFTFTSKLVDGRFPDYRRTLPTTPDKILIASRETLKQAFTRAAVLSNEKFRGVRVNLEPGSLRITANNPEQEEAEEWLDVDYPGEPLEIGFNVSYILDVLNTLKCEQVKMSFTNATSSVVLESYPQGDTIYVVMPMRL